MRALLGKRGWIAALVAAAFGFGIWLLSIPMTGRKEPWDGSIMLYVASLFVCGALCVLIAGGRSKWHLFLWPAFLVLGQLMYMATQSESWSLWPLSLIALSVCSLPAVAGAALVRWILGLFAKGETT